MITIQRGVLYRALRAVALFQCKDETRFHLSGVYFETSGRELRLVATDGHTLVMAQPLATARGSDAGVILAAADVAALIKAIKPLKWCESHELVLALRTGVHVSGIARADEPPLTWEARGVDSKFPPWRAVVPERVARPDRDTMLELPRLLGLDPRYLARAGEACVRFEEDPDHMRTLELAASADRYGPARFDYADPDTGDLCIVIMPMRL